MQLIKEKQDLTHLSWSVYRDSSGAAGSFLKAYSKLGGKKVYYKLSNFDKTLQGLSSNTSNAATARSSAHRHSNNKP